MSELYSTLRNNIRFYWLTLRRDVKQAFTRCTHCKALGASPCSICARIVLCDRCQLQEAIKLGTKLRRIQRECINERMKTLYGKDLPINGKHQS